MREHVKVKPMIIDGEPDDIVYDDYDDDVVAESEEEIDAKYGKEPEGFHDDEEDEEEFDEDVDENIDEVGAEGATEGDGEDETGEDSWDNLKMSDFEFEIEKESIPEARFTNVPCIRNRSLDFLAIFDGCARFVYLYILSRHFRNSDSKIDFYKVFETP